MSEETEKKPMSGQRITMWVGIIVLVAGGLGKVGDSLFDISGKWNDYRDKQALREINHNAEIISDSTISKVIREIDPLTTSEFNAYREDIDGQMTIGKKIALGYMNTVDSLIRVVNQKDQVVNSQRKRIDVLEVELKVASAKTRDEGLETVMQTLEKLLNEKSQTIKLDSMMTEIKKLNQKKIESIKSGDRAQ